MRVQISERELEHMDTFKFVMLNIFEASLKKKEKKKERIASHHLFSEGGLFCWNVLVGEAVLHDVLQMWNKLQRTLFRSGRNSGENVNERGRKKSFGVGICHIEIA